MSARPLIYLLLLFCVFATGCSSAPRKKTCVHEKTGDVIEYSDASDGRSWSERNHFVGDGLAIVGIGVLAVAFGVTYAMAGSAGSR